MKDVEGTHYLAKNERRWKMKWHDATKRCEEIKMNISMKRKGKKEKDKQVSTWDILSTIYNELHKQLRCDNLIKFDSLYARALSLSERLNTFTNTTWWSPFRILEMDSFALSSSSSLSSSSDSWPETFFFLPSMASGSGLAANRTSN